MNMLDVIRGARTQTHLPCPFCGAEPPLAAEIAGRFVVACENDDCAANPQVSGTSLPLVWQRWNRRVT